MNKATYQCSKVYSDAMEKRLNNRIEKLELDIVKLHDMYQTKFMKKYLDEERRAKVVKENENILKDMIKVQDQRLSLIKDQNDFLREIILTAIENQTTMIRFINNGIKRYGIEMPLLELKLRE